MSHLEPIFAVWGDNAEALAADIDEKGVTVRQWRNRGDIPSRAAQLKIITAAWEKKGKLLKLEDFLSPEERLALPGHGAAANAEDGCGSATNSQPTIGDGVGVDAAANNPAENIRREGQEADSRGPFSDSPSTCSTTLAPSKPCASPACSTGTAEAA